MVTEHSPVGASQSDGKVESAIKRIEGQIGITRAAYENRRSIKMRDEHPAWQ